MGRREKLRTALEPAGLRGAEIGSGSEAVILPGEGDVVRVADADALRPAAALFGAGLPPPGERLDYVIAADVMHRVPDAIGWLLELQSMLKPAGEIRLSIPDARAGGDRSRRETTATGLLAAHLRGLREAGRAALSASASDAEGAWAFTPHGFAGLCAELAAEEGDVFPFECFGLLDTEAGDSEFYVGLRHQANAAARVASWEHWRPATPLPPRAAAQRSRTRPRSSGPDALALFIEHCAKAYGAPRVLQLGARGGNGSDAASAAQRAWLPRAARWTASDTAAGPGVDLVADVHRLSRSAGNEAFDIVVASSAFEHFKYPQFAAHEIMRVLKVGGALFVRTHQSYPLHGYPQDYYRYSREGLAALFPRHMGFEVVATVHELPAVIESAERALVSAGEAWLDTCLFAKKVAATPGQFVYEPT